MAEENKSGKKIEFNSANTGLNLDSSLNQIKKGTLSYALNANIENFDANSVNYQNEEGNELCLNFPSGYQLIGKHFIQEQNKHIFFLTNSLTGDSEIGYMLNNDCVYRKLVGSPCLGWDVRFPIHKIVHRITNCSTELFWPDNIARRYLDIDNIPYKLKEGSDLCDRQFTDELDCNRLKVQPNFSIPTLNIKDVITGGDLETGAYQFAIQYSNASSDPYTKYYSVTNAAPIADVNQASVNFDVRIGKSIVLEIDNLDATGQFEYFNLAVIKTVNNIPSVELAGTYFIDNKTKEVVYTGQQKTNTRLTLFDIFEDFPYYDLADDITTAQDILIWKGVSRVERTNYQSIASQIKLQWESYRIPKTETYADEINAVNLRGYLRDEVYSFEIVFLLRNGKETDGFHIPGRALTPDEATLPIVTNDSPDFIGDSDAEPYWKIYNTASISGTSTQFSNAEDYKGPYQYGEFAYWESLEEYPCNEELWGELAGQKIRHHKMPDVLISPIIETPEFISQDNLFMGPTALYPLGVKINIEQIKQLIFASSLTSQQKDDIVGFKIVRGDRTTNKSIVAKGMIRNVGEYEKEEQTFLYPNYPYNDLGVDPFLNKINNAWSELCDAFELTVYVLPQEDELGKFIEVQWVDCNTNKTTKQKFRELGTHKICSIGKPVVLSAGVTNSIRYNNGTDGAYTGPVLEDPNTIATVGYINYDVYRVSAGGSAWKVGWDDPISGPDEMFLSGGLFGGSTAFIAVRKDTVPFKVSGSGGPNPPLFPLELYIQKREEFERRDGICSDETPLEPLKEENKNRLIFNSPETSFAQPFLGNVLKMESVIYGKGKGHFVEVKDNAKYRLLTAEAQKDALKSSIDVADSVTPLNIGALFTMYQSYLTIYVNGITRRNYAYSFNSVADYAYSVGVPNGVGEKQRMIDTSRYLIPVVQSIGNDPRINNYQRETSVYIKTTDKYSAFDYAQQSSVMLENGQPKVVENSRFTISDKDNCSRPGKEEDFNVVTYYASMKNIFDNQWGQIYSYSKVDTGFQVIFSQTGDSTRTVFGGDTFIGKFAYKTKVPFFLDNRVRGLDDSDIFYDEIGNIAYPKFWHSARSILEDYTINGQVASNIISYKAHNFDCPNSQLPGPESDPPVTADTNPGRTFYDGYFYLFAYGVPSFYCESSYNLDLRQAFNDREGNFWPRVSTGIPDDWLQESFVSIANDNTYNYNVSFSKQNKENNFTNLPPDWTNDLCLLQYPFRAIYSDLLQVDSDADSLLVNNWLIYRPLSYFDFPQNFGNLVALDGIENRAILARFENKTLMYDKLLKLDTSNPQAAYVGNSLLFRSSPPIDFAETDLGYVGSQNKFLLKIPQGQISVDAKRGQIFLLTGNGAKELSALGMGMTRFFRDNLPFNILRWFPSVNIDNHFNGIGIHGVYDNKYNRIILTKLDYSPLSPDIQYDEDTQEFFLEKTSKGLTYKIIVTVDDTNYFCNKSFTISFNFNTNSWISFHSYLPNFYIGENNFFYSGVNNCCGDGFDAIVGELIPYTTTSTTTIETTVIPLPTTTTTTTIIDCTMGDGVFVEVSCELDGTAVITVPPSTTTTLCVRGFNMAEFFFITGYVFEGSPTNTTPNAQTACAGASFVTNLTLEQSEVTTILFFSANAYSIQLGEIVYLDSNSTDCTTVPNGWYYTEETAFDNTVFRTENGIIVEIIDCLEPTTTTTSTTTVFVPTTTTTSTSTSTTSTTTTVAPTTSTTTSTSTTTTTTTILEGIFTFEFNNTFN